MISPLKSFSSAMARRAATSLSTTKPALQTTLLVRSYDHMADLPRPFLFFLTTRRLYACIKIPYHLFLLDKEEEKRRFRAKDIFLRHLFALLHDILSPLWNHCLYFFVYLGLFRFYVNMGIDIADVLFLLIDS